MRVMDTICDIINALRRKMMFQALGNNVSFTDEVRGGREKRQEIVVVIHQYIVYHHSHFPFDILKLAKINGSGTGVSRERPRRVKVETESKRTL